MTTEVVFSLTIYLDDASSPVGNRNSEVARALRRIADRLEVEGENCYRYQIRKEDGSIVGQAEFTEDR